MQHESGHDEEDDIEFLFNQAAANIDSEMGNFFHELVEGDLDNDGPLVIIPSSEPILGLAAFNNTSDYPAIGEITEAALFDPITQEIASSDIQTSESLEPVDQATQDVESEVAVEVAVAITEEHQDVATPEPEPEVELLPIEKTSAVSAVDLPEGITRYDLDDFAPEDLELLGTYSPKATAETRKDKLLFTGAVATGITVIVLVALILSGNTSDSENNLALEAIDETTTTETQVASNPNSPSTLATVNSSSTKEAPLIELPKVNPSLQAPTTLTPPTTALSSTAPSTTAVATTRRATTTTRRVTTTTTARVTTATTTRPTTSAAPTTVAATPIQTQGYTKDVASASMVATYTVPTGTCLDKWQLTVTDAGGTEAETGSFTSQGQTCESEWVVSVPSSDLQVGANYQAVLTGSFTNGSAGQISSDFVAE